MVMFIVSNVLLGALIFFIVFGIFLMVAEHIYSTKELAFSMTYIISYLLSVLWQHRLNRCLVLKNPGSRYCSGLLQSYLIYSSSLFVTSMMGTYLIKNAGVSPRNVTFLTLSVGGVVNYLLLKLCFPSSGNSSSSSAGGVHGIKPKSDMLL